MTFRPLDKPRGGVDLSEWHVAERDVAVDGVSCCRLKRKVSPGLSEVLCLAIDGDFRVIRYSIDREGKWPYCQVTIKYVDCEGYGKVPIAWTGFETSDSCPLVSCRIVGEATVLETNPELPASEFEYKFPPGALVTHKVSRQYYIARHDGSLRLITEGERRKGIPYDVLMTTDPPAECGD
jgi:hypothetical protein